MLFFQATPLRALRSTVLPTPDCTAILAQVFFFLSAFRVFALLARVLRVRSTTFCTKKGFERHVRWRPSLVSRRKQL